MCRICCTVLEKLGSTLSDARFVGPDIGSERTRVGWLMSRMPQDRERLFMVAASREHFNYNPFVPPVSVDEVNGHRKTLDEFIDRTKPGSRESYLSKENRYYKMIDREMASGESGTNIFQLRRSYVREKIWSLPDIDREHGYRRAQRAVRARPLGHSPVKRRRGSSIARLRRS